LINLPGKVFEIFLNVSKLPIMIHFTFVNPWRLLNTRFKVVEMDVVLGMAKIQGYKFKCVN
jgi:hypothetical protein